MVISSQDTSHHCYLSLISALNSKTNYKPTRSPTWSIIMALLPPLVVLVGLLGSSRGFYVQQGTQRNVTQVIAVSIVWFIVCSRVVLILHLLKYTSHPLIVFHCVKTYLAKYKFNWTIFRGSSMTLKFQIILISSRQIRILWCVTSMENILLLL